MPARKPKPPRSYGSGSIRWIGDGVFEVRVPAGVDAEGRRRSRTRKGRGSQQEAEEALRRLYGEVGRVPIVESGSVGDLIDRWLAIATSKRGRPWSPLTKAGYEQLIGKWIRPQMQHRKVRDLTRRDIDGHYAAIKSAGASESTVEHVHVVLRSMLTLAVEWGWIAANPAAGARVARVDRREISPPTPAQVRQLIELAEAKNPDLAAIIRFAAATGCRRGEVCAVRWRDVDLENGSVLIHRNVVVADGRRYEKDTKNKQKRRVSLDPDAIAHLRTWRTFVEQRADRVMPEEAYVFSRQVDGMLWPNPQRITGEFGALCKQLGLECRFHDLRHFVGSSLISAGWDARAVADRLGHHSPIVTLDFYAHTSPARDREAADYMGSLLRGD